MSTSSAVRLVLFDVDGALVDHEGAAAAGFPHSHLAPPGEAVRRTVIVMGRVGTK